LEDYRTSIQEGAKHLFPGDKKERHEKMKEIIDLALDTYVKNFTWTTLPTVKTGRSGGLMCVSSMAFLGKGTVSQLPHTDAMGFGSEARKHFIQEKQPWPGVLTVPVNAKDNTVNFAIHKQSNIDI
jgi:hypothetical protein